MEELILKLRLFSGFARNTSFPIHIQQVTFYIAFFEECILFLGYGHQKME